MHQRQSFLAMRQRPSFLAVKSVAAHRRLSFLAVFAARTMLALAASILAARIQIVGAENRLAQADKIGASQRECID
jgi:hypothetical protein